MRANRQPGDKLGHYEIVAGIGSGGMGDVYRARDPRLGRDVAIKVLPEEFAVDPGRRQRFETEAKAVAALSHPNIVALYDVGVDQGLPYMVTELIDGASLRGRSLTASQATDLAAQIADGLAAAHELGITHRDLKPDNVLVTRDGRAKILDFGLATRSTPRDDPDATQTAPGVVMGTPGYMSPEQVRGHAVDPRTDIFSFGALLHEMLTGQRAFHKPAGAETMNAILNEDPAPMPETVPAGLRQIAARCMEKEPARRFQSARDLAFAVRALSGAVTSTTAVAAESGPVARARSRWLPWAFAAAGCAVAVRLAMVEEGFTQDGQRLIPFATEQYGERNPAWSPDGRTIAYVATVGGVDQIMVKSPGGSSPAVVTRSPGFNARIDTTFWSVDGNRIYYLLAPDNQLMSVDRAGGSPRLVLDRVLAADLSPIRNQLAVLRLSEPGDRELTFADPNGGSLTTTGFKLPGSAVTNRVAWSPDGARVAVNGPSAGRGSVGVYDLASKSSRQIRETRSPRGRDGVAWAPHGHALFWPIGGSLDERTHLAAIDPESGESRIVFRNSDGVYQPAVAPNGRQLAFTAGIEDLDLMEIPLDGSPVRTLLATRMVEYGATWTPGADDFVYSTQSEIRVRSRSGASERVLATEKDFPGSSVRFSTIWTSSDGSRVMFSGPDRTLWVSPIGGGTPARVLEPGWAAWGGDRSPDGSRIVFNGAQTAGFETPSEVWMARLGGGDKPVKIHGRACRTAPAWSPRGDWIACVLRNKLLLLPVNGGPSREFTGDFGEVAVWSRDGAALYVIRNPSEFGALDVRSGVFRPISRIPSDLRVRGRFTLSHRGSLDREGKAIAVTVARDTGDIWIVDGFREPRTWWERLLGR